MREFRIIGYGRDKGRKKVSYGKQIRHRMDDSQSHYTMSEAAIDRALEMAGMTFSDMDLVVFAGAIGYQPIPCSAAMISHKYAPERPVPCMDINTTCTSFITALDTVSYMIEAGRHHRVLILSADTASLGINPKQKESFELFSDGAAAVIVEKAAGSGSGVSCGLQETWSEGAHDTEIRGGLSSLHPRHHGKTTEEEYLFDMKGPRILRMVAGKLPGFMKRMEQLSGTELNGFDLIIPHQASRALPMMMKRLGVAQEKYMDFVDSHGNMIATSVPYMLCKAIEEKRVQEGDRVLLFGTAAGLTISGLVLVI